MTDVDVVSVVTPSARAQDYIGDELELFEIATTWKAYFAKHIAGYISGDVAEVGAGLGGTTKLLCSGDETSWTALEPDTELCKDIERKVSEGVLPNMVKPMAKTLSDLPSDQRFDSLLYIDVLEHIEQDKDEIERAAAHLKPGGYLIVLAPAHQFLYTPFDRAIGHFRRYNKASLVALEPSGLELRKAFYLDSIGMLASLANKIVLRQAQPKRSQIRFWDRVLVPASKLFDPLTGKTLGKTVIAIWQKPKSP
ncbi:MAG: class I SAM-dependent methyltransferase [Pseudomonadota bacterium]